jgi:hypothetical protein
MSAAAQPPAQSPLPLTPAQRDWIRRQGAGEAARRRLREQLAAARAELTRLRTGDGRPGGRFAR